MKIEQLAPYLPYGLIVREFGDYLDKKDVFLDDHILEKFRHSLRVIDVLENVSVDKQADIETNFNSASRYYKPILRPLSDLTKKIEHNGEKFVAFGYIHEYCLGYKSRFPNRKIFDNEANAWSVTQYIKPESLSYNSFKILLEWHFDVFRLIESGEAININTLKK